MFQHLSAHLLSTDALTRGDKLPSFLTYECIQARKLLEVPENLKEHSALSCGKHHFRLMPPDLGLNNPDVKAVIKCKEIESRLKNSTVRDSLQGQQQNVKSSA